MRQLLDRIPADHVQSDAMRKTALNAIEVAERFSDAKAKMATSGKYTAAGLDGALRELLPGYAKQLEAAKAPLSKLKREAAQRRQAIRVRKPDPTDLAAAIERQEIRQMLRELPIGARSGLLASTRDIRLLEAALTAPPELSGLADERMQPIAERAEANYLEIVHGPEAKAVAAIESVVDAADAIAKVARGKIRDEMGMDPKSFDAIVGPAEKSAGLPWLVKSGTAAPVVCEVDLETNTASYRPATEWEREVGVFYANADEWRAAQGSEAA